MDFDQVKKEVDRIGLVISANPILDYTTKQRINLIYNILFGRDVKQCNCKDVYTDSFFQIKSYIKNNKVMKTALLKNGVLVHFGGKIYTNANLTDEIARAYLQDFPQNEIDFAKLPEKEKGPEKGPEKKGKNKKEDK